jgi:hypothetical protein
MTNLLKWFQNHIASLNEMFQDCDSDIEREELAETLAEAEAAMQEARRLTMVEAACIEKYGDNDKQNYSKQIAYLKSL